MQVSRYSAPFSCANLISAMLETSTDRFSRKSPLPISGSSTWRKLSRVSGLTTNLTPNSAASRLPASSAVTMVMRSGSMPMWRSTSGNTPWPMLPKPTKTRRPGNCTWTGKSGMGADSRWEKNGRQFTKEVTEVTQAQNQRLLTCVTSVTCVSYVTFLASLFPVRRHRALVPGQRLHAANPRGNRREVALQRQEARPQLLRLAALQAPQQHLDAGKHHDVGG